MAQRPGIPKGTRDFQPVEVVRRDYIFDTIRSVFETYGYQPIETPSFEKSSTLMGKYGEEGDRLIFKLLNSGDYLKKISDAELTDRNLSDLTPKLTEKALRYDLTVPFARYVVQNQNDIVFPFKRYQMQPVWRADRPQKGRFREFYQCDADVVGSKSLWQDVEFVLLYDEVFSKLGLRGTTIKLNNRKVLAGLAEVMGISEKLTDLTVALDKLDKVGAEGVKAELRDRGIAELAVGKIEPLFDLTGSNQSQLEELASMLKDSAIGMEGLRELRFVVEEVEALGMKDALLELDFTLARGLNYYTGTIYEVSAPKEVNIGAIGGGGRYDDLTGIFGLPNLGGIGISFGLDRIYLVLEELGLFDEVNLPRPEVLFVNFGTDEARFALQTIYKLREEGIRAELYPDSAKMKKQMTYANKRGIPFVVIIGSSELASEKFTVKNMKSGDQKLCDLKELREFIG